MNIRLLVLPLTALLAGVAGGLAARYFPNGQRQDGPIRTTRIELVDGAGNTLAFLGADGQQGTALVFTDAKRTERAKFGVQANTFIPTLELNGKDGRERVAFDLRGEKPTIILRDQNRVRVRIGYLHGDLANWGSTDSD